MNSDELFDAIKRKPWSFIRFDIIQNIPFKYTDELKSERGEEEGVQTCSFRCKFYLDFLSTKNILNEKFFFKCIIFGHGNKIV